MSVPIDDYALEIMRRTRFRADGMISLKKIPSDDRLDEWRHSLLQLFEPRGLPN